MKQEILNAIKLAEEIAEKKGKLVVGTGRSRVPQDSEGNPTAAPIMIHFDAGRNIVFFRTSDENGDPWGFEFPLEVAEALTWALNDLLGIFDECQAGKIEALEEDLATTSAAANYFAEEKQIVEKKLEEATKRLAELEHFAASVSGLYATDRPDDLDPKREFLFEIKSPEAKK